MMFPEWWKKNYPDADDSERAFAETIWDAAQEELLRGLTSYGDQPLPPDSEEVEVTT